MGNGKSIANETAASLDRMTEIIGKLSEEAKKVAVNSQSQAKAIKHTSLGVDQISSVVQNNSATAEESAVASEELSSQANILQELVANFTMNCSGSAKKVGEDVTAACVLTLSGGAFLSQKRAVGEKLPQQGTLWPEPAKNRKNTETINSLIRKVDV